MQSLDPLLGLWQQAGALLASHVADAEVSQGGAEGLEGDQEGAVLVVVNEEVVEENLHLEQHHEHEAGGLDLFALPVSAHVPKQHVT